MQAINATRGLTLLSLLTFGLVGCSTEYVGAKFPAGNLEVDFVDPPGVHDLRHEVSTQSFGGAKFRVECRTLAHEASAAGEALQMLCTYTSLEQKPFEKLFEQAMEVMPEAFEGEMVKKGIQTHCAGLTPDRSVSASALSFTCQSEKDGDVLHTRFRTVELKAGFAMQMAGWVSPRGKEWADAFWDSLRLGGAPRSD